MAVNDTTGSNQAGDKKHKSTQTPATAGEDSLSGSTTDLEADDNALDAAQSAGLYENADEEHPAELNIAGEIEKDERTHQKDD